MELIFKHANVMLYRNRKRLDIDYDANETLGFRDLNLHLSLINLHAT